jgi:hypothetical protein
VCVCVAGGCSGLGETYDNDMLVTSFFGGSDSGNLNKLLQNKDII